MKANSFFLKLYLRDSDDLRCTCSSCTKRHYLNAGPNDLVSLRDMYGGVMDVVENRIIVSL